MAMSTLLVLVAIVAMMMVVTVHAGTSITVSFVYFPQKGFVVVCGQRTLLFVDLFR
jgi:uncharacterized membrane protein YgaE (UPF0421/DUF939 family)